MDKPLATALQKHAFEPAKTTGRGISQRNTRSERIRSAPTLVSMALDMKCFKARLHLVGSFNLGVPWVVIRSRACHYMFADVSNFEPQNTTGLCMQEGSNPKRGLVHQRRFAFTHLNGRDPSTPHIHLGTHACANAKVENSKSESVHPKRTLSSYGKPRISSGAIQ